MIFPGVFSLDCKRYLAKNVFVLDKDCILYYYCIQSANKVHFLSEYEGAILDEYDPLSAHDGEPPDP